MPSLSQQASNLFKNTRVPSSASLSAQASELSTYKNPIEILPELPDIDTTFPPPLEIPVDNAEVPTKQPFMATGTTADREVGYGKEDMTEGSFWDNLYGATGLRTWARKTWAKIFDPVLLGEGLSDEQLLVSEEIAPEVGQNLEDNLAWSKWIEPLTGITSEEAGESLAATIAETDMGDTAQSVGGVVKRASGQVLWTALGAFGALDKTARSTFGVSQSLDDMLEEETGKPSRERFGNYLDFFVENNMVSSAARQMRVVGGLLSGDVTTEELQRAYIKGISSSNAVYAMNYEESLRSEFTRRYNAGEDPGILTQEFAAKHPWVELGGSVIFDPTTYMGLGAAKYIGAGTDGARYLTFLGKNVKIFGKGWKTAFYIPDFGDFVKLNVGTRRIVAGADSLIEVSDEIVPILEKMKNPGSELEARAAIKSVIKAVSRDIDGLKNGKRVYGAGVMSSTGKQKILVREVTQVMKSIFTMPGIGAGEKMEYIRAMVNLSRGEFPEKALSVIARSKIPSVFASKQGLRTAEVLGRIADSGMIEKILNKSAKSDSFLDEFLQTVETIAHDIYPSIDEMWLATKGGEAAEKLRNVESLKEAYKTVPEWAKKARSVARAYEKAVWNPQRKYMGTVFLAASAKQPARNAMGQFVGLAAQLGLARAAEITFENLTTAFRGQKAVSELYELKKAKIVSILGIEPGRFASGIGIANELQDKAWGFMKISQWGEEITSMNIYIDAAEKVMNSALAGSVPKIADFNKLGLDGKQSALALRAIEDAYGRTDAAMELFKEFTKGGEIEDWRFIKPTGNLREFLNHTHVLDEYTAIQKTSQTAAEFAQRVDEFLVNFRKVAEDTLRKEAGELDKTDWADEAKRVMSDMEDMVAGNRMSRQEYRYFENMVQAWQNARNSTDAVLNSLNAVINQAAALAGMPSVGTKLADTITQLKTKFSGIYPMVAKIRVETVRVVKELRSLSRAEVVGLDVVKIWNELRVPINTYGDEAYSIAEMFPDVNPAQKTVDELIDYVWRGYFYKSGEMFGKGNLDFAGRAIEKVNEFGKIVGLDIKKVDNFSVEVQKLLDRQANDLRLAQEWQRVHDTEKLWGGGDFNIAKMAKAYGFSTASKTGVKTDSTLLSMITKNTGEVYESLDEVPPDVAKDALDKWRKGKMKGTPAPTEPLPPYVEGTPPTAARVNVESATMFSAELRKHADRVISEWGKTSPNSEINKKTLKKLSGLFKATDDKVALARSKAISIAEGTRDFILHDYNKTGLDMAIAYYSPFIYWQTRTYARGIETILENPQIVVNYMKYRKFMENEHAGWSDFWKYNAAISLPGTDKNNPLLFNLEATLNPYYSALGTDFNDPNKRVDWFTRMVDDGNQLGLGSMPLLNWGIALGLYNQGRAEAGDRWLGRFFPQSRAIKAAQALTNVYLPDIKLGNVNLIKHGEIDPLVNLAMGGQDSYERRQTGRAGAAMMLDGTLSQEEGVDVAWEQSGENWEAMTERALDERAPGTLFSEFMGVGFKSRSVGDMKVDEFYTEYRNLMSQRDSLSPEKYRMEWDKLRDKYSFADTVLLSAKSGEARDAAYAYNVLGRIPPGDMSGLLRIAGIERDQINSFYDNKGDMTSWESGDRDTFIGAISRLATLLKLPNQSTRAEWTGAKLLYTEMQEQLKKEFGDDILEKISGGAGYYAEKSKGIVYGKNFLEAHPEVKAAMARQDEYIIATPALSAYYGGLETVERNFRRKADAKIAEKYGEDIFDLERAYAQLVGTTQKETTLLKKAFMEKYPILKAYYDSNEKRAWQEWVNREVVEIGKILPSPTAPELRDIKGTDIQEKLKDALVQPQRGVSAQELSQQLPPQLLEMIQLWMGGEELSYSAMQQLDYFGGSYGLSGDEVLQIIASGQ